MKLHVSISTILAFAVLQSCSAAMPGKRTTRQMDSSSRVAGATGDAASSDQNASSDDATGAVSTGTEADAPAGDRDGAPDAVPDAAPAVVGTPDVPVVGVGSAELRWMIMGDQPLATLSSIPECTSAENINRAVCSVANEKCRSKFVVTCDTSTDCRRLFKCTTGTSAGLIWFPMGDSTTAGQFPTCSLAANIAGSACATQNDRCLSAFTVGTGTTYRLFKCLPSGGPGLLFWRWAEDKTPAELASIGTCSINENIAGTACTVENSKCKSSFCTVGTAPNCTKIRLFKCTP